MLKTIAKSVVPVEIIQDKIYLIRGMKVMLGLHLALLYGVETRALMQAVKRNQDRFPEDFSFELDRQEIERISQFVISLKYSKTVYVFTEQGVAMLSSVLRSPRAVQVNIQIMRVFTKLREMVINHKELAAKLAELEWKVNRHDKDIHSVLEAIYKLTTKPVELKSAEPPSDMYKRTKVGFKVS